jgi:hypothetical protein
MLSKNRSATELMLIFTVFPVDARAGQLAEVRGSIFELPKSDQERIA